jgi:hypothetical protein
VPSLIGDVVVDVDPSQGGYARIILSIKDSDRVDSLLQWLVGDFSAGRGEKPALAGQRFHVALHCASQLLTCERFFHALALAVAAPQCEIAGSDQPGIVLLNDDGKMRAQ